MSVYELQNLLGGVPIDDYLKQLDQRLTIATRSENKLINQSIRRIRSSGGKRIRPCLVIAASGFTSPKLSEELLAACCAVELAHMATLVHDDIIDKAPTRRSVLTINAREGVDQAIVIGDFLLACSATEAAKAGSQIALILWPAIAAVCIGQSLELNDQFNLKRSRSDYFKAVVGKTASLIAASCQVGAVLGGRDSTTIDALRKFGHAFGLSFQILDDLLDLISTEAKLGKPIGNDLKEGVYTLPIIYGLKGPNSAKVERLVQKQRLSSELIKELIDSGSLKQTLDLAKKYNQQATAALTGIKGFEKLASYPPAYFDLALQKQSLVKA